LGTKIFVDPVEGVQLRGSIEAPVADIVSDEGIVFLFGKTVVIFVTGTATGEEEGFGKAPTVDSVLVDELRAFVAMKLTDSERTRGIDDLEALQGPAMGIVEEDRQPDPDGGHVGEGEVKFARIGCLTGREH
jgi:hypothetical protein